MSLSVRISASGDTAVTVEFGSAVNRELSTLVLSADAALGQANFPGVIETLPTFRSLLVQYDPLVTTAAQLIAEISPLLDTLSSVKTQVRKWVVPVCYEEEYAADIAAVATATHHTVDQVIEIHSSVLYHVYMLGFLPGFPYMGDLPEALHLPRLSNPRTRVPPGSISIATSLTSIYPYESPGGWHLVGITPLTLFDLSKPSPALFSPGDQIKFEPITKSKLLKLTREIAHGDYELIPEVINS